MARFADRADAARRLSARLTRFAADPHAVVLGVPRGGLVVAAELARRLALPLDAVFAKKLGHPLNPEYAIGVVTLDGAALSPDAGDIPRDYLEGEAARIKGILSERRRRYLAGRGQIQLREKTALVVDDGAATGLTVLAAVQAARQAGAAQVVVALPAASKPAAALIQKAADLTYFLRIDSGFLALADYYDDFSQVDDEAAIAALSLYR